MKKLMMIIVSMMAAMSGFSQTGNLEPEFIGQVVVVNTDSTTKLLPKEQTKMKSSSTSFGLIPIPGTGLLDKSKVNLVVKGAESEMTLNSGRLTFIFRAGKNDVDPKSVFGIFQFEVKKKKRQFQLAEAGMLSGVTSTISFNTVPYEVKKYGNESYLIVIENAEPGQYGITTTDISYISTFGVK